MDLIEIVFDFSEDICFEWILWENVVFGSDLYGCVLEGEGGVCIGVGDDIGGGCVGSESGGGCVGGDSGGGCVGGGDGGGDGGGCGVGGDCGGGGCGGGCGGGGCGGGGD